MKNLFLSTLLLSLILFCASVAQGQGTTPQQRVIGVNAEPAAGGCANNRLYKLIISPFTLWKGGTAGACVVIGGGSGTVTSVTGTANQVSSTGGATPVISLPSALIFPGSLTSPAANPADAGVLRLGNAECVAWEKFVAGADWTLCLNASDELESTANVRAPSFIGNLTGNASGSSGSTTGNAGTATALQNARLIGGTSFDGTANITPGLATTVTTNANSTGDVTSVGNATTLATVNGNVGAFGSATQSLTVTANAKGLITAVSAQTVTPAVGSITGLGTGVGAALAVNVGSAGAPVLLNGAGGTPSSLTLTSATGLPLSTGVTGTLPAAQFPALAGDVTTSAGSLTTAIAAGVIVNADINGSAAIDATKLADGTVTSAELQFINTLSSNAQTQIAAKQASDATLTALAAYNTNGLIVQTAADTFAGRTITGTANQVVVSNGDGVAGNPTLSLPQSIATSSTPQFGSVGLGVAAGNGLVTASRSTTDSTNTAGANTHIYLQNASATGQSSVYYEINGTMRGKVRADFVGNLNYAANGGGHFWYTGGDGGVGTERMNIASSGVITLNTGNYNTCTALTTTAAVLGCTVSDRRVKQGITPYAGSMEFIRNIQPKTYSFRQGTQYYDGGRVRLGLIAQEVAAYLPKAVIPIGNGLDQIDYDAVVAEHQSVLKLMDARLTALENENKRLRRLVWRRR